MHQVKMSIKGHSCVLHHLHCIFVPYLTAGTVTGAGADLVIWGPRSNSGMGPSSWLIFTLSLIEYVGTGSGRKDTQILSKTINATL